MFSTLLRRLGSLPGLVLLLLVLGAAHPALAGHLLGGEMTYKYLDATGPANAPLRYEITVVIYNNCGHPAIRLTAPVAIYDQATGAKIPLTTLNYSNLSGGNMNIPQTSISTCLGPSIPAGCTVSGVSQPYQLQYFIGIVNLPTTNQGFYAVWTDGTRNTDISNLFDPSNQNMSLYSTLSAPSLPNSSPVFSDIAVAVVCGNDTTYLLNNAVDPDGDRLTYSFGQPYGIGSLPANFTPPPTGVPYVTGYTSNAPFSTMGGNYAAINPTTGTAKYYATVVGRKYVVAVDVNEFRTINNRQVLIGTTRRDLQLVVANCPSTTPPTLPTTVATNPIPRNYTVEAGGTLTIPLVTTQADGHGLTMTVTSVLLDGTGGYNATLGGNPGTLTQGNPAGTAKITVPTTTGTPPPPSTITSSFVYTAGCNEARANPYDVSLSIKDDGCAGKLVADLLRITVTKPAGPNAIAGDEAICGLNTTHSYTASGGAAPQISWRAVGGTIVGSNTASPVQVTWPTAGTFTLVARGITQYGCLTDSVTKTITVSPAPSLTVTGNQTICQGSSTTLTVNGGGTYTVTGGATPVTGTGPFVLSPAATTTYTITGVATGTACGATTQVTVTVNLLPTANAGTAVAICSGATGQLGTAGVAGNTYSWSPATGLSSTTVANPTVTLTNTTSTAITQTYTLTTTTAAGCTGTATVVVTVSPQPTANAGTAVAICSGATGQLGTAGVAGNTYSWSPATGLSSATVANPTVTLTNTTGAAITQTYTLTITNAGGCTGTATVVVTVNPQPAANAGAAVAICSGATGQLGAAGVAGNTYSWSPATGLSSTTVANPTVTLTNTTGAPITQTYTLTTTAAGCTGTATVVVTVNPLPTANAGLAVAICSGVTGQLGATGVAGNTYSWSPATGLSSATAANPTVTLTNTTGAAITQTYTLTTTNAGGCTGTATVVVTVNPQPAANAGSAVAICSGATGQLGAAGITGLTYSWSPATGLSSATVANPTVTLTNTTGAAITQTYTLTTTNAGGCTGTATVVVTVNPLPTANAGPAVAICSGATGQLGAAGITGLTYSWSPSTGLSSATVANPTVTLTNTTSAAITQTYTLTTTTAAGCTGTATVVVTVSPQPTANAGTAVAICSGATGQLGTPAATGLTYSWSPATGLSSATVANPTVTLTNTTGTAITQTYTLTTTNAGGCTGTATVVVTVNPLPTANVGAAVAICSGATGQLGAAGVAGNTYSWSPATGLSSTTIANPTVMLTNTTSAATTQTYTLTATSATGCVATATVVVTVNPLPVALTGPAVAICSGATGQLGATGVAGNTYSWSPATGLSSATAANPTVTLTNTTSAATTQTYTLTTTTAAGCTATATVVVTVNPLPTANAGAAVTICSGATGQLGAAGVAGNTYSWSPTTGLSSATVANPTVTLTNTSGTAMTQTYTLTTTNAAGCAATATVVLTINPVITAGTIGADQTVCAGTTPSPLTNTAGAGGGTGTYTYQWESSADGTTWAAIASTNSPTYAPGTATAVVYYRRRVTSGTCGDAVSNVVKVQVQAPLAAGVTLATPAAQCAGIAITFTPVPANAGTAPTYRWFVNGTLVATTATYTSSTLANGDQVQVELTPTVGFCATGIATATVPVTLIPVALPTVTMSVKTSLPACSGAPVTFSVDNVTNAGTTPQYQWQVNGTDVAGATTRTFISSTLSNGQSVTVTLRVPTACGTLTVVSSAVAVAINPLVLVQAGPDKTITEGESVVLEGTANGTYPVTWTPANTLTFLAGNMLRPVAAPLVTTTYTLSGGIGDCASQSTVTVTVTPRVRVPNAISPNGDGRDDTWEIDNIGTYPENHVLVFNRWGNKVFEATNYNRSNEWNGSIGGQPAPIGTYYYVITLGNGKSFSGPLTVIY